MSAKMGVFGADLWIFLADRTIEFTGDLKMFTIEITDNGRALKSSCLTPVSSSKIASKPFLTISTSNTVANC